MDRRTALQGFLTATAALPLTGLASGAGASGRPRPGSGHVPATGDPAKPAKQKMVLVGAGSAMFTQGIVIDWIKQQPAGEWEIALVDINPVILEATEKMVRRYMSVADKPAKISAAVDRKEVLDGATIVICTIGVGSRRAWEQDVFVPRQFGIFQPVGDSVGPGGVSRSMRMIPPMVAIASDCDRMCPTARFINYGNPMTAVVRALWRKTNVRPLGLCMGTEDTLITLARLAGVPPKSVTGRWVGLNHLTWILEMRSEGRDLWPAVRASLAARQARGVDRTSWANPFGQEKNPEMHTHPFSWELFEEFGAFPAPMDRHVTEFFLERFPRGQYYGSTLGVDAYSFEGTIAAGDRIYDDTITMAKQTGPIDKAKLLGTTGEHEQALEILDSVFYDKRRWYSANVPNDGIVSNLPPDAVLEVPAVATQEGMVAPPIGEIPVPIAAVLLRRIAAVEATVDAALTGNRRTMAEALILDGGVSDYATAVKLTDALLKAQAEHLPQFA
jgi:alpha-galactosidase